MKKTLVSVLAVSVGLFAATAPMLAHHSFAAEFDGAKPVALTGTVTKVDWVNPHSWIYIDVKGDDGTVANWGLETGPPTCCTARVGARTVSKWAIRSQSTGSRPRTDRTPWRRARFKPWTDASCSPVRPTTTAPSNNPQQEPTIDFDVSYGAGAAANFSSVARRTRIGLTSSSFSSSAQPATIRIPSSWSFRRYAGSSTVPAMSPRALSIRRLTAISAFE